MKIDKLPPIVGAGLGLAFGAPSFLQPIGLAAQLGFGAGLLLTYASIGLLVGIIPASGPRWFFGLVIGVLYSLPGAVFTSVSYPLRDDAPAYYREFVAGGVRAFVLTLVIGAVVGLLCGLTKPLDKKS